MLKTKYSIFSLLGLSIFMSANVANAQEAVLMKLDNIASIKDDKNSVVGCDLTAVIYNRTSRDNPAAEVSLTWKDEVIEKVIEDETAQDAEDAAVRRTARARRSVRTENLDSKNLVLNLNLPAMKPQTQVEIKTKVATDKCFLLLKDPMIKIEECGSISNVTTASAGGGCSIQIDYVGPKDAQYYTRFQAISLEQQKEKEMSENDKLLQEINHHYSLVVNSFQQLDATLK